MKRKIENPYPEDFLSIQEMLEDSYSRGRNWFPLKYPYFHQRENFDYSNTFIIRDGKKILSLVRIFPLNFVIRGEKVKAGGIGSVATRPEERGKGYMRILLNHCIELMKERGYAFSILGGDRQRYNYFGYETCGYSFTFLLTLRSLEKSGLVKKEIKMERLVEKKDEILQKIKEGYEKMKIRMERPFSFYEKVLLERLPLHTIYTQEEGFAYLIGEEREEKFFIRELGGDEELFLPLLYSFLKKYPFSCVYLEYPPLPDEVWRMLYLSSSTYSLRPLGMVKILSLEKTLKGFRSFLEERMEEREFLRGKVKETGEEVFIQKREGKLVFLPSKTGEPVEKGEREWVRIIFGPPPLTSPLDRIFPFPFHWWRLDHV